MSDKFLVDFFWICLGLTRFDKSYILLDHMRSASFCRVGGIPGVSEEMFQ